MKIKVKLEVIFSNLNKTKLIIKELLPLINLRLKITPILINNQRRIMTRKKLMKNTKKRLKFSIKIVYHWRGSRN